MKDSKGHEPSDYKTGVSNTLNGLEALGDLRNCLQAYFTMENVPSIDDNLKIIEKSLKAIEIIKEKGVNIGWLIISKNCSQYNLGVGKSQSLKKKEYNFLKEVLCEW